MNIKKILIIQNSAECPAAFGEILDHKGINYETIHLENREKLPESLEGISAIIVFGGGDSANDMTPKMIGEIEFIKKALELNIPYLGLCLGLQTLVKAAGGKVRKNEIKEIGLRDPDGNIFEIQLTDEAKNDPLFFNLPDKLITFQLHGETVDLTDNMKLLGYGKFCKNQAVKVKEKMYGLQCHFELNDEVFNDWLNTDEDLKKLDRENLKKDFEEVKNEYKKIGETIFDNFLKIAALV